MGKLMRGSSLFQYSDEIGKRLGIRSECCGPVTLFREVKRRVAMVITNIYMGAPLNQ
jgi:hypothetical protein